MNKAENVKLVKVSRKNRTFDFTFQKYPPGFSVREIAKSRKFA